MKNKTTKVVKAWLTLRKESGELYDVNFKKPKWSYNPNELYKVIPCTLHYKISLDKSKKK